MTAEIIKAVCRAIYEEFGEEYQIYTEAVPQGLKTPCFFVSCIARFTDRTLCDRYLCTFPIAVQYIPEDSGNAKTECGEIADRLFFTLDRISVSGSPVNGVELHCETVEGLLNFFVTYNMAAQRNREAVPKMEKVEITDNIKQ